MTIRNPIRLGLTLAIIITLSLIGEYAGAVGFLVGGDCVDY